MERSSPFEGAQEIQEMLISYAKQETVEPLKHLGRYLGLGIVGAVLVFAGAFFAGMGALRLLQTFEVFGGTSWASTVPYAAAVAVLMLFCLLSAAALSRAKKKVRSP